MGTMPDNARNPENTTVERKNFIAGEFVSSSKRFPKLSPVDGSMVALVHEADRAQVDQAVQAARQALRGPWGKMPLAERIDLLRSIAAGIEQRFDDFLAAEIADTGKPIALASRIDIPRGAANFRIFADLVRGAGQDSYHLDTPDGKGALNYAFRKPLGVVGVISPWNLPLLLLTWKVAPALACGNTVVVKPSEETPSTATLLAEVMKSVGMPDGVFNLVHGFGPDSAGEFLTTHPDVDAITFTGESATGSAIMRAVAASVKPVSFELGGKNAGIIFSDCDFDAAVAGTARSVFENTGQVCLCTERLYVQRPIFERFVGALKQKAEEINIGWPRDVKTNMGPLISKQHRDKVLSYYSLAKREGAEVVTGGGIPSFGDARDNGAYVEPTIWTGLTETARCVKEEVFGPVCHIAPFDEEDAAIAIANDTEYGLASTVWTTDLSRGHRVAQQMATGIAWVNCWFLRDLRTPFGGMGLSGIGREGGRYSLDFYSEPTNVCIKL
jgi:aminomuconate-semialdehyde/2-hydroxymuconate-6-semialdehyde dehydrogenase